MTHFNFDDDAYTSSAVLLSVSNVDANTVEVSAISPNDDTVDFLSVGGLPGSTSSETSFDGNTASVTVTWADGAPAVASFEVMWSKVSSGGNWMLTSEQLSLVNTSDACPEGPAVIPGCTDENAENYISVATEDNGSCTYPAGNVNVTFQVDMSAVETHAEGVYLAGGPFGQDGHLMTDNGSDVWSVTLELEGNQQYLYKFRNQPSFGTWEGFEDQAGLIEGGCGTGGYNDRFVDVAESDIVLDVVSYGSCSADLFVDASGCMDANATNYNADATIQSEDQYGNLLCVYASCEDAPSDGCVYAESFGAYHDEFGHEACVGYGGTACGENVLAGPEGEGCLDANADNYNADATVQGLDQYGNLACNYSSCDDIPDAEGCMYTENYSAFHDGFNADNCVQYGGTPCGEGIEEPDTNTDEGCLDANADNYNAEATVQGLDQYGNLACDYTSCDNIPDAEGCMYPANYSAFHDGFTAANCEQYGGTACTDSSQTSGCLDANATNYNADATVQSEDQWGNLLCVYTSCDVAPSDGCVYAESFGLFADGFGPNECSGYGGTPCGEGVEEPDTSTNEGCLDANATNYDAAATVQATDQWDNQLCVYASCDDVPSVGCMYADAFAGWHESFNAADCSTYGGTPCEGGASETSGCLDTNADNYNADATVQGLDQWGNIACNYSSCDDIPDAEGCMYTENYSAFHDG
ncbi:MAG: hypothetical protein NZ837_04540, partial [Gammaproteobacteria bacterium]|nr:hypothetical protein [Gammaproteobacteria bacterium]